MSHLNKIHPSWPFSSLFDGAVHPWPFGPKLDPGLAYHHKLTLQSLIYLNKFFEIAGGLVENFLSQTKVTANPTLQDKILAELVNLLPSLRLDITTLPSLLEQLLLSKDPNPAFESLSKNLLQIGTSLERIIHLFPCGRSGAITAPTPWRNCRSLTKMNYERLFDHVEYLMAEICCHLQQSVLTIVESIQTAHDQDVANEYENSSLLANVDLALYEIDMLAECAERSKIKAAQDFLQYYEYNVTLFIGWLSNLPSTQGLYKGDNLFFATPPTQADVQVAKLALPVFKLIRLFLAKLSKTTRAESDFHLSVMAHDIIHKISNKVVQFAGIHILDVKSFLISRHAASAAARFSMQQLHSFKDVKYCVNILKRLLVSSIPKNHYKLPSSPSASKIQYKSWLHNWLQQYTLAHQRFLNACK